MFKPTFPSFNKSSVYNVCLRLVFNRENVRAMSKTAEETKPANELYSIQADEDIEILIEEKEKEIERKRNKSKLLPQHYNILHGRVPYDEPKTEIHYSLRYNRKMFGRYGYKSGVNPGTLWPTEDELKEKMEYEKIAYPYTVHEMWERARKRKEEEERILSERQAKIAQNIKKINTWKKEINDRLEKKLAAEAQAKAKKDALVEEVRRHFGYKVDPRDEKFKEMLVQKEKEQKKRLKMEKLQARQEKLLADLTKTEK